MTAYRRRRQDNLWAKEEEEEDNSIHSNLGLDVESSSSSSSLAAKAIRASSARRDSSLSSAYGQPIPSPTSFPSPSPSPALKDPIPHEFTSTKNFNASKHGFWGALAKKAKAILEDDNGAPQSDRPGRNSLLLDAKAGDKHLNPFQTHEHHRETESPTLQRGLNAIASSLNSISGAIGNALEEGLTVVENRTADIIQETRKLHIRRKASDSETQKHAKNIYITRQQTLLQTQQQQHLQNDHDIQLKASRDVAMAMATKAKLLLRELKTVKADLAFAKDRCAQLEEENRMLRQNREKGDSLEDDDLIRLQLETLLAEKARLAQENVVYARENRFLKEVVEYHQLTMQDVVYLDEGTEEVTEVYPIRLPTTTNRHPVITPHASLVPTEAPQNVMMQVTQDLSPNLSPSEKTIGASHSAALPKLR